MSKLDEKLRCSFCGKTQDKVFQLIAGPGVYICDECVQLSVECIEERKMKIEEENLFKQLQNRITRLEEYLGIAD